MNLSSPLTVLYNRRTIHPNGPELALEENQNPTVFERQEYVARSIRASHKPSRWLPLSNWTTLGWIFDWKVGEESWIFWPLCCEVWKRSDARFGGNRPGAGTLSKQGFLPCPSIIKNSQRRTFKITQKTVFEAKGRLYTTGKVIQHLFIIDLCTQLAISGYRWGKR